MSELKELETQLKVLDKQYDEESNKWDKISEEISHKQRKLREEIKALRLKENKLFPVGSVIVYIEKVGWHGDKERIRYGEIISVDIDEDGAEYRVKNVKAKGFEELERGRWNSPRVIPKDAKLIALPDKVKQVREAFEKGTDITNPKKPRKVLSASAKLKKIKSMVSKTELITKGFKV